MNNIIKKYIGKGGFAMALLLMATGGVITSCSDSTMESINTDKTKVDKLDPNAQLTTSLLQTYGDYSLMDTYRNYITGFPQYFAGGWNVTNYSGSNFFQDDIARLIWDRYYEISIKNLVDAIHNSEDKANLNAALRIHRVYLTAVLADIYGDVPCSEAGLGYISGISTPKYDTVEELYSWFFEELDACEKQLGTGTDRISGDADSHSYRTTEF
ncbi:SusD/RagB family nutrient-binding outer membrane lipoprotein [uncultured Prevotella sp.]|uniref:SusD/RagB family nutrient-binding outer membrane lipoprotein n=1 Tax=uncultured Prevotella sp. TaxID=159272 RepID=UPI0034A05039